MSRLLSICDFAVLQNTQALQSHDDFCLLVYTWSKLYSTFSPDSPSAVTVSTSPSSDITVGVTLRLACCSPEASSTALFRWYKSTSITPRHTERVWNITEVTSNDSGSYYCQIQTGDKVQNSSVLAIDVQCKWSWIMLHGLLYPLQYSRHEQTTYFLLTVNI